MRTCPAVVLALLTAIGLCADGQGETPASSAPQPRLPQQAKSSDFVVVAQLDAGTLDAQRLSSTADALLGPNAGPLKENLEGYESLRNSFLEAGGTEMTILVSTPDARGVMPGPVLLFAAASTAQRASVRSWVGRRVEQDSGDRIGDFGDRWVHLFSRGTQPVPPSPEAVDPDRSARFEAALAHAGDAPLRLAIVPNAAMRNQIDEQLRNAPTYLKPFQTLLRDLVGTRSLTLWLDLEQPYQLRCRIACEDEEKAANLAARLDAMINAAGRITRDMANQPRDQLEQDARLMLAAFDIIQGISVSSQGSQIDLTLPRDGLAQLSQALFEAWRQYREQLQQAEARVRLRRIVTALHQYAAEHNGRLPDNLTHLVEAKLLTDAQLQNPRTGANPGYELVHNDQQVNAQPETNSTWYVREVLPEPNMNLNPLIAHSDGSIVTASQSESPSP